MHLNSGSGFMGGSNPGIKSIQAFTITIANGAATGTQAITAVDVANSFVLWLGTSHAAAGTDNRGNAYVQLTSSILVTATRSSDADSKTDPTLVSFLVVEMQPGVIKSIQVGLITLAGVASNTAAITAVNTAKTFLAPQGWAGDTPGSDTLYAKQVLTSSILVTVSRGATSGNVAMPFAAVEFN